MHKERFVLGKVLPVHGHVYLKYLSIRVSIVVRAAPEWTNKRKDDEDGLDLRPQPVQSSSIISTSGLKANLVNYGRKQL